MAEHTAILLDLGARGGATARAWREREAECLRALAPASVLVVQGAAGAEAAARGAALQGAGKLVAAGGAAVHGVLNALMGLAESHRAQIKFGVLTLGGHDPWALTLGWPRSFARQLELLRAGQVLPHDVGRADCLDQHGRPLTRYFLNGASFGIAEEIRAAWRGVPPERHGAGLGRLRAAHPVQALRSLRHTLRLLGGSDPAWARIEGGAEEAQSAPAEIYQGPWVAGLLMVGRFYPGLGEVAPHADPCDGALDLVSLTGRPGWRAWAWLAGLLPRSAAAPHDRRGTDFHASGAAVPLQLALDGVHAGHLPASFTILPRQLHAIVPTVPARVMKPKFRPIAVVAERPLVAGRVRAQRAAGA